jgi:hypothetical protein
MLPMLQITIVRSVVASGWTYFAMPTGSQTLRFLLIVYAQILFTRKI